MINQGPFGSPVVNPSRLDVVLVVFLPSILKKHFGFHRLRPVFVLDLVIHDIPICEADALHNESLEDTFEVIVSGPLDRQDGVDLSKSLLDEALQGLLAEDGIVFLKVGQEPHLVD